MVISVAKMKRALFHMLLFVGFTIVLYFLLSIVGQWVKSDERYHEPSGRAVKVFRLSTNLQPQIDEVVERLKLFILTGE